MSNIFLEAKNLSMWFPAPVSAIQSTSAVGGEFKVSRNKRELVAIDSVSFRIEHGDRLGLIGHNGSGKSTLLKLLAGILYPSEGYVNHQGSLGIALNTRLGFRMEATGRHNLHLKSMVEGFSGSEIDRIIADVNEFAEMDAFLDMPMSTYSAGMRARLTFGILTAFNYDILILDEWIGAGDRAMQKKASLRMNEFLDRSSITVLASHSEKLMRKICNKGLVLEHGKPVFFGAISDSLDYYDANFS